RLRIWESSPLSCVVIADRIESPFLIAITLPTSRELPVPTSGPSAIQGIASEMMSRERAGKFSTSFSFELRAIAGDSSSSQDRYWSSTRSTYKYCRHECGLMLPCFEKNSFRSCQITLAPVPPIPTTNVGEGCLIFVHQLSSAP